MGEQDKSAGALTVVEREEPMLRLVFFTSIAKIEQRSRVLRAWKDAEGNAHTLEEDLGWFACYDGSYESVHLGHEKPPGWRKGRKMRVIMEPVEE